MRQVVKVYSEEQESFPRRLEDRIKTKKREYQRTIWQKVKIVVDIHKIK